MSSSAASHLAPERAAEPPATSAPKEYVPAAESRHVLYQVATEHFVGPLDLLLFLIRRHELDIFDIPMAFVCSRYFEVLESMQQCDLDVAAEFMACAAELLHIKSRMLLPKEALAVDEQEEDPRASLVERLLLLKMFQAAAQQLALRPQLGRDVFAPAPQRLQIGPRALRAMAGFDLACCLLALQRRQAPAKRHQIMVEQVPLRQRMHELLAQLYVRPDGLPFASALCALEARIDLVILFLAVLELAKQRLLTVEALGTPGALLLAPRLPSLAEAERCLAGVEVEKAFH